MPCPPAGSEGHYANFTNATQALDLWEALYCPYGVAAGELVVGAMFYSAVGLAIYARTGSPILPFVLVLILGGTILAQMLAVISNFVAILILITAPLVVTALVYQLDRRS